MSGSAESMESQVTHQPPHEAGDVVGEDEASRLKDLATEVRDQDDLERDVNFQADRLLTVQANERDQRRLEKTEAEREKLRSQVRRLKERLNRVGGSATALRVTAEIANLEDNLKSVEVDLAQIQERISSRHAEIQEGGTEGAAEPGNRKLPSESQRDFLIRTGKITPFSKLPNHTLDREDSSLQGVLLDAEEDDGAEQDSPVDQGGADEQLSHRNLMQPGFTQVDDSNSDQDVDFQSERPIKRRRLHRKKSDEDTLHSKQGPPDDASSSGLQSDDNSSFGSGSSSRMIIDSEPTSEGYSGSDSDIFSRRKRSVKEKRGNRDSQRKERSSISGIDDGNEKVYQKRLKDWTQSRQDARAHISRKKGASASEETNVTPMSGSEQSGATSRNASAGKEEWHLPHPTIADTELEGGLRIPGDVYPSLFDYQKTGVRWLWELFSQRVGGIVGDEMGLGKTIQVIAFLAGLHHSGKLTKPVLIVTPATVMKQWVSEFHTWWPPFRVSILHSSGSGMVDLSREEEAEDDLLSRLPSAPGKSGTLTKAKKAAKSIVERVKTQGHILVTTYTGLQSYADLLIPTEWEYAVLDEGHKIRNPNIGITIYCKELRTPNRIILSGTPMQNNLVELWSLFDFIFPMRLGTLVSFREQFEFPIRHGGYANATNLQVQTALKCAEMLKDTISPYLLQRFKADVASDLPKKSEQVLFCKLTKPQREAYESFLASDDLNAIMAGKRQVLYGVDLLRKICNHPDLQEHKKLSVKAGYNYGSGTKSGKMQVVKALLELWREQGHKTLLFAQHRIMLDILEKFVRAMPDLNYRRMDGMTPIQARQGMVDEFNTNIDAHVFLLTTKVGGLGINLTGADRVIIFDPDWNPSTDIQARERAWRLGQKREVMIYRLMTSGTIEEKIYHRQLFKQFLINKILRDPKQRQTFQMRDLHDLFTLGGADDTSTETGSLFKGTETQFGSEQHASRGTNAGKNRQVGDEATLKQVDGVAGLEHLQGEEEEESKAVPEGGVNSDARVMEGILGRSGVHAAFEHDQIVNGKRVIAADPKIIEQEAKRVAALAAKELKKAGDLARNVPIGTPTWTGEYGTAGRPEPRPNGVRGARAGPVSSAILNSLHNQSANGRLGNPDSSSSEPKGSGFMKMIRNYLMTHGGQVHTQMLIDHFNQYCNTPEKTVEFKAMLTEIATLQKGSRGRGKWILKEEYKSRA